MTLRKPLRPGTPNLLIFISGPQGSGKTTLSRQITEYLSKKGVRSERHYFAETLYDFQDAAIQWAATILGSRVPGYFKKPGERFKNGPFLQKFGDVIRETFGDDILIQQVEKELDLQLCGNHTPVAIVDDGRLPLEFERMQALAKKRGARFVSIRLECEEALRKLRLGDTWRPATGHKTETGLGGAEWREKFDYVFDTSTAIDMMGILAKEVLSGFDCAVELHFAEAAEQFTEKLRDIEETTGYGANFKWTYTDGGTKRLEVADLAPIVPPTAETVAKARAEITDIMEQAMQELVGKPVEVVENVKQP